MTRGAPKPPSCPLGRLHTTRVGAREAAKRGRAETGVIVIFPDMLKDDLEREFVNRIADREYGAATGSVGKGR